MSDMQSNTEIAEITAIVDQKLAAEKLLTYQQECWIDYCAIGGLRTDEDGRVWKMTMEEFATEIAISRSRLYAWKKTIVNFSERVMQRRKELGVQNRVVHVYNGLYLKGRRGDAPAAALFLANTDPDFRMPTQKVEHDAGGGLADMLEQARKRSLEARNVQEGELVDPNKTDT